MTRVMAILAACRRLPPRPILAIGWAGLLLYAYPGFMSFDSVYQLIEAREGVFSDGHPPAMGALWRIVDSVIAGPFGMLVLQTLCFLVGSYRLFAHWMSERAAAVCASLLLWYPPVASVMAVIWKDSQMAGFLMLGTACLLSPRRGMRIAGLALYVAGTAMRHNALAMTFPLVILLFAWDDRQRWFKRYPIAIAAWLAVTFAANTLNGSMTTTRTYIWHQSLALLDIVGTLRYAEDVPDAELREILDGTPLLVEDHIQDAMRAPFDPRFTPVDHLWEVTADVFRRPKTKPQRLAVVRAWKAIVPGHPAAYLEYRWQVFRQLVQLTDIEPGSSAYVWYTDVIDPNGSAARISHNAVSSGIQFELRSAMMEVSKTWMFRPYLYLFLALLVLPFALRDRATLAIVLSALSSEAALFLLTPTTDYRYSFWLALATTVGVIALVNRRYRAGRAQTL